MIYPDRWSPASRRAHGAPCRGCGKNTYAKKGVCVACKRLNRSLVAPGSLPEDYLLRCAEELLKRHNLRAELIAKLGIPEAA